MLLEPKWSVPHPGDKSIVLGGSGYDCGAVSALPLSRRPSSSRKGTAFFAQVSGAGKSDEEPPNVLCSISASMMPGFRAMAARPEGSFWVRPSHHVLRHPRLFNTDPPWAHLDFPGTTSERRRVAWKTLKRATAQLNLPLMNSTSLSSLILFEVHSLVMVFLN